TVINMFNKAFPKNWDNETRTLCRRYFGQVIRPLLAIKYIRTMEGIEISARVGNFLREDGKFADSATLLMQNVEFSTTLCGPDDLWTLANMDELALTYQLQGRTNEACELQEEVLHKRKEIFGDSNRNTLTNMDNLAMTYQLLGHTNEACKLQEEVLRRRKEILGDSHPDTLTSMNNLALTYQQ